MLDRRGFTLTFKTGELVVVMPGILFHFMQELLSNARLNQSVQGFGGPGLRLRRTCDLSLQLSCGFEPPESHKT